MKNIKRTMIVCLILLSNIFPACAQNNTSAIKLETFSGGGQLGEWYYFSLNKEDQKNQKDIVALHKSDKSTAAIQVNNNIIVLKPSPQSKKSTDGYPLNFEGNGYKICLKETKIKDGINYAVEATYKNSTKTYVVLRAVDVADGE